MENKEEMIGAVKSITKVTKYYQINFSTGEEARLYVLNDHVFRYYVSPKGIFLDYPEPMNPEHEARIVYKHEDAYGLQAFKESTLKDDDSRYIIETKDVKIIFHKTLGTMEVHDLRRGKEVFGELRPLSYKNCHSMQTLRQRRDEYFFGGGMQNGRFTHKGEVIEIVNTNKWNDGDVASPCPFYWSSSGYGALRNTFRPGEYDFGIKSMSYIETTHNGVDFDAFYFINELPRDILNDYYELTGKPILLPEYAYYEAHLNAFNRDYWVKVTSDINGAILFEDGQYYKCFQPNQIGDKTGILESLNGDENNYQFSARAMIDRYKKHDLPLGWFIPNDGYGSGYGQTDSMDGDIQNLKRFSDYALQNGVECALWTESNLTPKDPLNPKKGERDLSKEVGIANVVALKCDVAWVGSGYSFGLSAIENATDIFVKSTRNNVRPFIIMVDGWAGCQRYAGIWSGDQKGGEWEYIRFHIPTYIGAGLSGIPLVGSDMDGIYAGGDKEINIREYQWKTFTPIQLNMDGWGHVQKTPFTFGEEATYINRGYLKLKSMLIPYNYSIGYESIHGLPMVRAMFLEYPGEVTAYTLESQYQYMWGPNILVAPIYSGEKLGKDSLRDGIYLPDSNQIWIDFLTGEKYQGGKIYNNIVSPLWKIPVFVKDGAIIPTTNPNNNPYEIKRDLRVFTVYPNGTSSFIVYEDDGITSDYLKGSYATTKIHASGPVSNKNGDLIIKIHKTKGHYKNIVKERRTLIQVMCSRAVGRIKVSANEKSIRLKKVRNSDEFANNDDCFYHDENFQFNPYLKNYAETKQKFLLIKLSKLDVTACEIIIKIKDVSNKSAVYGKIDVDNGIEVPKNVKEVEHGTSTIGLQWDNSNYDYNEVEKDGVIYTNIKNNSFIFNHADGVHECRVRSVVGVKASKWSEKVILNNQNVL
nr:probable glucan 1,3-alpha-glucosidase [Danaus plexippus plexippus]XP_032521864.1 probable glucan 1,3-alpha-glucosidase [Danaus plexippus plexippus]XP_032521865.1 probable glucan 1,3-alpha-glucosidase [Danaus plexippus plexippus]XP_032521866.1 probable glucan 1,3-alpha-glucosidase [Danaus plexippus plexippus]XP_032521867.1 probable glucan 1,3-alpha-glucosidase [Danaus plexippus plexippus]XP_032521870.1 probable glucan 1,3-alpha-glucosidase [Danaus plexippus plexippus]